MKDGSGGLLCVKAQLTTAGLQKFANSLDKAILFLIDKFVTECNREIVREG